jgi:hypothetical protein
MPTIAPLNLPKLLEQPKIALLNRYPVCFFDTTGTYGTLQRSDLTIMSRQRMDLHFRVHRYVLLMKCPRFYKKIKSMTDKNSVVFDELNPAQLRHILSFIYTGEKYPFSTSDPLQSKIIEMFNSEYGFIREESNDPKSREKKGLFSMLSPRRNSTVSLRKADSDKALTPQPSPPKKKSLFKSLSWKKSKKNRRSMSIDTSPLTGVDDQTGSPGSPTTPTSDQNYALVFREMNNNMSMQYEADLILYGAGAERRRILAHAFVVGGRLVDLQRSNYALFPFFKHHCYMEVFSYLYGQMPTDVHASFMDIVQMIYITLVWDIDRENDLLHALLANLSKMMTPSLALQSYRYFEELNLGKFVPTEESPVIILGTKLTKLPLNALSLILRFLSNRVNQDCFSFFLFTPSALLHRASRDFFTIPHVALPMVRNTCLEYMKKNWEEVKKELSQESIEHQTKIQNLVASFKK